MDFFAFISEQWLLVSLLLVLIYTFAFTERLKGGKPIPAHEVTRLLNGDSAILLDVRESKEFKEGHITGALNIPAARIDSRLSELEKHRGQVVVIADKMGQHGGAVGKKLKKHGFDVRRLQGGMTEWRSQNLPLVKK